MKTIRIYIVSLCLISLVSAVDYYPLAEGNEWNYDVGNGISLIVKVEQKLAVDDGTMFNVAFYGLMPDSIKELLPDSIEIPDSLELVFEAIQYSSGNDVFSVDSMGQTEPRRKLFEHNPQSENKWNNNTGRGPDTIIYVGEVTVPAGTFQSCYAVFDSLYRDTTWYAPDVGKIASSSSEFGYYVLKSFVINNTSISSKQFSPRLLMEQDHFNKNIYFIFDPLGRCVKSDVCTSNFRSHKISQGMYLINSLSKVNNNGGNRGITTRGIRFLNLP